MGDEAAMAPASGDDSLMRERDGPEVRTTG